MAVILPTGQYRVLRRAQRPEEEDEHGVPVPAATVLSVVSGFSNGAVREQSDGGWTFRLDPALWPLYVDDIIEGDEGQFVIRTLKLNRNVAASALDHIAGSCAPNPNPRR